MIILNFQEAIERIYAYLEADNVEQAVMACVRLARTGNDHLNAVIFLRELYPDKHEVARALLDDTAHLKPEAQKYILEKSFDRWVELHTVDADQLIDDQTHLPTNERKNIFKVAAGDISFELEQWEKMAANASAYDESVIRMRMRTLHSLKTKLKIRCLNYAIQIERQLGMQKQAESFLWNAQNEVHNYFKEHAAQVYEKLQTISRLSASTSSEDAALLLTEVRRILKAVADYVQPAVFGKVRCSDGQERELGDAQYMNRLQEFIGTKMRQSTAKEVALAEVTFLKRLNDMASKGVHDEVVTSEARQGLVGMYMFLFNLCQHLTSKSAE